MKRIFFSFFLFIMISSIGLQFAAPLIINKPIEKHLDEEFDAYWRELTRGVYHVLLEDLKALPPEEWDRCIRRLQPHFGYPISLDSIDDLPLSPAERRQLMDDRIVVKDDGNLFHRRMPGSQKVVTMGPIQEFDSSLWIDVLVWSIITLTFGLMALIWARPFWLKLKKISIAAQAFGRGEFAARVDLSRRSALSPLANTFNDMAGRIQQLINSHKELTRAVSHELRTPISRIRFSLEMAHAAGGEPDRLHYLAEIGQDVDELDSLVSELLIYARFDRETPDLDREEQLLAPWLAEKMRAAKTEFSQTTCTCRIAEEDRERIFEPFVRVDSSRNRDTDGHGLGLAIVKRIVALHRGRVWVARSSLGGARFTICWPCHGDRPGSCHLIEKEKRARVA
jgi:signal transduction histidine kinase